MATKKQRLISVKGFIRNNLHERHRHIDNLVGRLNDLEEECTLEYWAEEPNDELLEDLEVEIKEKRDLLEKVRQTNIVLSGKEWSTLLELKMFGDVGYYYYLDGISIDIAYRSDLDPNEKYRLAWWIGGELQLFPVHKRRQRKPIATVIDRDDSSMYPCLKKVMISEPSTVKNPVDSRFLWNRNERRGD